MRPSGCTCSAAISRSQAMASHRPLQRSISARSCVRFRSSSTAGATANDPDSITVFFGGSASLSTPVAFMQNSGVNTYVVQGPVGFSANADPKKTDVVAAVQGAQVHDVDDRRGPLPSTRRPDSRRSTVTPVAGQSWRHVRGGHLVAREPGTGESMGRIAYTVDASTHALRTQRAPSQRRPGRAARERRRQPQGAVRTRHRQRRHRRFVAGRHRRRLDGREPADPAARDAAADSRGSRGDRHAQRAIRERPGHRPDRS